MNHSPRVMLGIFSFNEAHRLERSAMELARQISSFNHTILILDESTDLESRRIAECVSRSIGAEILQPSSARRGKTACLNLLAARSLQEGFDVLLHFDSDLVIEKGCVQHLVSAIEQGDDLVSVLSLCMEGRNAFERAVRVLLRPAEIQQGTGDWDLPLVGHGGGYSIKAVRKIFPIPEARTCEDLLVLAKAKQFRLVAKVVSNAQVHHRMVDNVSDYLLMVRRYWGRFLNFSEPTSAGERLLTSKLGEPPPIPAISKALFEDPVASLLLPYLILLRFAARRSAYAPLSETWDTVESTKE
jgi:hypothetical protein